MNDLQVHIAAKRFGTGPCTMQELRFSARPGELLAIVGPSGAGKTTLLKIISGLERDFEGSVQLPADAKTSLMFQEPRLMPWLSVAGNLQLVAPQVELAQINEALQRVGLQGYANLFPSQLSGGMQRRVALLRAFLTQPQRLLLDEPFESLDQPTAEQLRAQLLGLWQLRKPTVLLVTHSLPEALALADRVLFLSSGPARIALDYTVPAARPRALESDVVRSLGQALLRQHPELLKGRLAEPAL